jgi:hypothetical protein
VLDDSFLDEELDEEPEPDESLELLEDSDLASPPESLPVPDFLEDFDEAFPSVE